MAGPELDGDQWTPMSELPKTPRSVPIATLLLLKGETTTEWTGIAARPVEMFVQWTPESSVRHTSSELKPEKVAYTLFEFCGSIARDSHIRCGRGGDPLLAKVHVGLFHVPFVV